MSGHPLFPLGHVVATPGAITVMQEHGIDATQLLARHVTGDWGDLCAEDRAENELAVGRRLRIFSSYGADDSPSRLWVITEADRSVTTILRPEDYASASSSPASMPSTDRNLALGMTSARSLHSLRACIL
jgi:hypothetical protein